MTLSNSQSYEFGTEILCIPRMLLKKLAELWQSQTGRRSTQGPAQRRTGAVGFHAVEDAHYNEPFCMAELISAISSLKSVSEGPDSIHNDMLRRLPESAYRGTSSDAELAMGGRCLPRVLEGSHGYTHFKARKVRPGSAPLSTYLPHFIAV